MNKHILTALIVASLSTSAFALPAAALESSTAIDVAEGGYERTPQGQRLAEGGYERTPQGQRLAEGGYERTPQGQRLAEGGYERTPQYLRLAEDGYDRTQQGQEGHESTPHAIV